MTHTDIDVGDVVYDLAGSGSKMQVVARVADTVTEHREREDFDLASYKSHPHLPVRDDDAVFKCVYLPGEPGSEPSGTYDFPAGRLARAPIEAANGDLASVQDRLAFRLVADVLAAAWDAGPEDDHDPFARAVRALERYDADLAGRAEEYVRAKHFGGSE